MGVESSREQTVAPDLTSVNRQKNDVVSQSEEERPMIDNAAAPSSEAQLRTKRLLRVLRARENGDAIEQQQGNR